MKNENQFGVPNSRQIAPLPETRSRSTNPDAALSRYSQRFLTEFSEKFSSYDGRHGLFDSLVQFLYDMTELDFVLIGKADADEQGRFSITTLAISAFGSIADNIIYPMWKGPCYEVVKGKVYNYPNRCREIFPENKTIAEFCVEGYVGYPLYDGHGNSVGLIAVMHQKEIEDPETIASILRIVAKRAEFELDRIEYEKALIKRNQELELTANRLQSTFDGVPAMIALLDVVCDEARRPVDFVISAANKAAADFAGCQISDLIGKRTVALYPEIFKSKLLESYLGVFSTGAPLHLEMLDTDSDKWFSIYVTQQANGKGVVAAVLEITERKKAEEERKQNILLTELDQAKTEFFNNVSHEFRTPLTLILGPLTEVIQRMQKRAAFSPEDLNRLLMVERNAVRLQKLVNTVLDFSRIEACRTDAIFQPTDIAEYTTLLAGNFRAVIEQAGLRFVVNCESVEQVYINHDMWEKIVLNLISNAFKFTFAGAIEVLIKDYKKHVQLCIRDSGIGISPSDIPKVFERFARIPNARCRTYEGSGIGLALVKELVNIHGGTIKVKSKPAEGSSFIIQIPKGKDHLPAKNIHELKEQRSRGLLASAFQTEAASWRPATEASNNIHPTNLYNGHHKKSVVLLVDDNSDLREHIHAILLHQFHVVTANNGRKALCMMDDGLKPDLILADVMMPEVDGYELLAEVRINPALSRVPFVFLSSKATQEARIEGMRQGADDYIIKPFSSAELLERISSRIRIASLQNEAEIRLKEVSEDLAEELHQHEELIMKHKSKLFRMLDAIPQIVFIFDSTGRINFFNKHWYAYTGLTEKQSEEVNAISCGVFRTDDISETIANREKSIHAGIPYTGKLLIRNCEGNYYLHEDTTVPIRNESGDIEMWMGIFKPLGKKTRAVTPVQGRHSHQSIA